jgi:hypothetical protein
MTSIAFGFTRIAEMLGIKLVQPLFSRSRLGTQNHTEMHAAAELRSWTPQYQPDDSFRGHFEFGLKYERLNFEFFSRVFESVDPQEIIAWVKDAPTGAYARRTAFFYEWFTAKVLDAPNTAANVGYVDALDADLYLTATQTTNVKRWKVRDNLPGLRGYCPLVHLGPQAQRSWIYDVQAGVEDLNTTYGADLLLRSSVWLTLKESRASFAIEREQDQNDRVKRFAAAMGELSGRMEDPLGTQGLETLQNAILGTAVLRLGIRQSPVFVGQSSFHGQVVHYIAPPPSVVQDMLQGLRDFEQRTRGQNTVARTAAVSFAFVYLHPLSDGNGRVHRFLLNHLLAADGVIPSNIIIPVSATIAGSPAGRAEYDRVLESFSKPLMRRYEGEYNFSALHTYPDGVSSDFNFAADKDALHAWRYPSLAAHVRYVSELLHTTVEHEMAQEAAALRDNDASREAIKQLVEMPDADADRIIASLRNNGWMVSGKLRRDQPTIFAPEGRLHHLQDSIVEAVKEALTKHDTLKK